MTASPKNDEKHYKTVEGKIYHWCPHHTTWTRHRASESEGIGFKVLYPLCCKLHYTIVLAHGTVDICVQYHGLMRTGFFKLLRGFFIGFKAPIRGNKFSHSNKPNTKNSPRLLQASLMMMMMMSDGDAQCTACSLGHGFSIGDKESWQQCSASLSSHEWHCPEDPSMGYFHLKPGMRTIILLTYCNYNIFARQYVAIFVVANTLYCNILHQQYNILQYFLPTKQFIVFNMYRYIYIQRYTSDNTTW